MGHTQQPQSWGSCAPQSLENIFVSNTSVGSNPKKHHRLQSKATLLRSRSGFSHPWHNLSVTKLTSDSHLKKTQPRFLSFPWSRKSQSFSLGRKPHLCHSGKTKALPWRAQLSHSLVLNTEDHKVPAPSSLSDSRWWAALPYTSKAMVSEFLLEEASSHSL